MSTPLCRADRRTLPQIGRPEQTDHGRMCDPPVRAMALSFCPTVTKQPLLPAVITGRLVTCGEQRELRRVIQSKALAAFQAPPTLGRDLLSPRVTSLIDRRPRTTMSHRHSLCPGATTRGAICLLCHTQWQLCVCDDLSVSWPYYAALSALVCLGTVVGAPSEGGQAPPDRPHARSNASRLG